MTLYLPDDLAARLRAEAKKARRSLSAYVSELASRRLTPGQWPRGFGRLFGSWQGNFPPIEDLPEDEIDDL